MYVLGILLCAILIKKYSTLPAQVQLFSVFLFFVFCAFLHCRIYSFILDKKIEIHIPLQLGKLSGAQQI